ncbi:MAG: thiamine phosphate synthase [Candidatus Omnitrophica bacterium]|nr:thiamine phosphate synthase [Candidatus Omnitrophota bacterium]
MTVPRIIDANFNRIREALRVIEDIIRFCDCKGIDFVDKIRKLRHSFTYSYIRYFGTYPNTFRDVTTDPGKTNPPTPAENIKEILMRNFFRVEEGLRSIEECSRISIPESTECWQKFRFSVYDIEQKIMSLIPDKGISAPFVGIYFSGILSRSMEPILKELENEKLSIFIFEPFYPDSKTVKMLTGIKRLLDQRLILIANRFDIAVAADIDGVHLEYGSLKADIVRRFMPGKIIGMTLKNGQELKKRYENKINYVAFELKQTGYEPLTDLKRNIKLYAAALLNPRQRVEKTTNSLLDGVIIKCCEINRNGILKVKELIKQFNGKKTRSTKG